MRALIVAVVVCLAHAAHAHQSSIKYVAIASDGHVSFTVAPSDVNEPLGLASDATPTVDQAIAPAAAAYVQAWVSIAGCTFATPTAAPDADRKFVVVSWTSRCESDDFTVDLTRFFAVDKKHEAIVSLDGKTPIVVRAADPIAKLSSTSLVGWIGYGMHHIYDGRDHICFVLALLLVIPLKPNRRTMIKSTASVITAFTIAHSISLIAASLGYVTLPSQLVESLIAVSIMYTAVEDVVKPDTRWRFYLAFGFGLIHGLGFAGALEELLPADHVVAPLLLFNLGVELGQLTIVVVVLPLLWWLCRGTTATRYRRIVMPALATAIFGLGFVWLLERVLEVRILGL